MSHFHKRYTPPAPGEAPVVAHVRETYFKGSENWIHTQLSHLCKHAPIVLTEDVKNLEEVAWVPPYASTSDRSMLQSFIDWVSHVRSGHHPLFREFIERHDAQILHAHFGPEGYGLLSLADACDIPLVTTFYGYDLSLLPQTTPKWKDQYQQLFRRGELFLVEGGHMKSRLIELGCPEGKVHVQHLGVEVDEIPFRDRPTENRAGLSILAAGRLAMKKGFPDAIRAFARVREEVGRGTLTIIGGKSDPQKEKQARSELRETARQHGVDDLVNFRGFIPHEELVEAYCHHDVFLSPSVETPHGDNEGGAPVTLIEASATGMPVVSTWHCDIPEVVKHEQTGLLAEEGDVGSLAAHLLRLYRNPNEIKTMGRAARNHINENYNARRQGQKLDNVYRKIVRN